MSIRNESLDAAVRDFMVRELKRDQANGSFWLAIGMAVYVGFSRKRSRLAKLQGSRTDGY